MNRSLFCIVSLLLHYRHCAIVTKCCQQRNSKNDGPPCISYDSSVMAETLDEAMFTFPNLASTDQATLFKPGNTVSDHKVGPEDSEDSDSDEQSGPSVVAQSIMSTKVSIAAFGAGTPFELTANGECPTYACMSCKMALLNGFLKNPNLGAADNATMTAQRNELALRLGTTEGSCDQTTRKRRFADQYSRTKIHKTKKRLSKRFVLMNTTPFPQNDENNFDSNTIDQDHSTNSSNANDNDASKSKPVLGVVTNLGCQYRRGEALENNSEWCGLCNLCWQWRKLPSDYYPNYLNEVNCDHNDDGCLSGFGECKPITRAISVMRKKGDDWVKESVETTTACECQVEIGSSLHGLVVK